MIRQLAPAGILLVVTACGGSATGDSTSGDTTLTVLAASSLTETFGELETIYEEQHEGVDVRISYDSSATLAGQAVEGAPADVLATADTATMEMATEADVTEGEPELFATNTMVLVVPAGNPAGIEDFTDIDSEDVSYLACEESAPCGALARTLLDANQIQARPRSFEVDVKAVLTKVELDEADAGMVYETDAVASGDEVETIDIAKASAEVNNYPIAALQQSENPDLAREWVDLVLSEEGQGILTQAGFGSP